MNIIVLGASGFIGKNLVNSMMKDEGNRITAVNRGRVTLFERNMEKTANVIYVEKEITKETDFDDLLKGQDIVYHLISSTVPTNSNRHISQEREGLRHTLSAAILN